MFYSYLHYTIRTLIVQVKPPNSRRKSRVCGGNSSNGKILIQSRDYFALSEKCKQRYRCHVCIWKSWAFSKRCSRVSKIKNQKNRRNAVKSTFLPLLINAADRNRTGTGITTHGILSPGRLPVPPLRHAKHIFVMCFERPRRDSNSRPPPWQGGALTNWATGPYIFNFYWNL